MLELYFFFYKRDLTPKSDNLPFGPYVKNTCKMVDRSIDQKRGFYP